MRTVMTINRVQAQEILQALFDRFEELQRKREQVNYDSDEWYKYSYQISRVLNLQDELINFYCEE